MSNTGTPEKRSSTGGTGSPSPSRVLNFDFWAERRTSKVIQDDLRHYQISDISIAKRLDVNLTVRCNATYNGNDTKVFKVACDDGTRNTSVVAFGNQIEKLQEVGVPGSWFSLAKFEVRKENPAYSSGAYKDLEIVVTSDSLVKAVTGTPIPFPEHNFKTLKDVKMLPDGTVIDVLGVIVRNWELHGYFSSQKIDFSLFDKTKETIKLTLWKNGDQPVGLSEDQVVALRRVKISSFNSVKSLSAAWCTTFTVNPDLPIASELLDWYRAEVEA